MTRHKPNASQKKRLSQGEAARILGVTREHLNRVINGHRTSRRLTRAYAALISR